MFGIRRRLQELQAYLKSDSGATGKIEITLYAGGEKLLKLKASDLPIDRQNLILSIGRVEIPIVTSNGEIDFRIDTEHEVFSAAQAGDKVELTDSTGIVLYGELVMD